MERLEAMHVSGCCVPNKVNLREKGNERILMLLFYGFIEKH